MAVVKLTEKNMPKSGKLLKEVLYQAIAKTSPLNDFIQIIKDLTIFEFKYKINSQNFFNRFQNGEMDDDIEFIRWANKYQEMKSDMEGLFDVLSQYTAKGAYYAIRSI